ncbi:hypothetical protein B0H17DRAFT_1145383 [Mycena rosella]|uniref:GDP/GTP exchange factor Sec2 N-terminal domain-containing protein n=1 Tax=Mycena rosella TaxID=1033263 RepID=A0AAD7G4N1_MYCRO|nr:hypothetical protein B0H17DRAFT_1145383 [Mycena rosella]
MYPRAPATRSPEGSAPANSRRRHAPRTPRRPRAGRSPASRTTGVRRAPGVLRVRCVVLRFCLFFVFASGSARGDERAHNADSSVSSPNPGESPTERSNSRFPETFFNGPRVAMAEADRARGEASAATRDKAALEAEIEALSQALFEEANRMVASERKRRAEAEGELADELKRARVALREEVREARETREELREAVEEKAALRSALRLIEGENVELKSGSSLSLTHGRSGSQTTFEGGDGGGGAGEPREQSRQQPQAPHALALELEGRHEEPRALARRLPRSPHSPLGAARTRARPSSPHLSAASTDTDDEAPLTFAPTGLPSSRTLPLDLDAGTPLDLDLAYLDLRAREDDSRSS